MTDNRTLIIELKAGSDMYGTRTADSDTDIRGVVFPSLPELLGLQRFEQQESKQEDKVHYALTKYVHLLLKGNPNVHEWLWAPQECFVHLSKEGIRLLDNREVFLSDKVGKSILGYLDGQTRLMLRLGPLKGMGEKRRKLVEEHHYDCKAAAHAIRLAWLGKGLYSSGTLKVKMEPDEIEFILKVKRGAYTPGEALDMVQEAKLSMKESREKNSAGVQKEPDRETAEKLLIEMHLEHLHDKIFKQVVQGVIDKHSEVLRRLTDA